MRLMATCPGLLVALMCAGPLAAQWAPPGAPAPAPTASSAPYGQPSGQPSGPASQPPGEPISAGGLAAPPPLEPDTADQPPPSETEKELDAADEKDAGRGLTWFWMDVEGGFQHVGLKTFTVDDETLSAGLEDSVASGGFIGGGLGVRLLFLTIGPRARLGFFSPWHLYSFDGEVGFRIPIGDFEPHFSLAAGYAWLGSLSGAQEVVPGAATIDGFNVRVGGGLDIFVTSVLSLGATFTWEVLGLTRPGIGAEDIAAIRAERNLSDAKAEALALEGSSFGTAIAIGARLGLHF